MVGPKDGGFGFNGSSKYSELEGKNAICVQCQAGQHGKCLAKDKPEILCDCELCLNSWFDGVKQVLERNFSNIPKLQPNGSKHKQ